MIKSLTYNERVLVVLGTLTYKYTWYLLFKLTGIIEQSSCACMEVNFLHATLTLTNGMKLEQFLEATYLFINNAYI